MFRSEWYRMWRRWKVWGGALLVMVAFVLQGLVAYAAGTHFPNSHPNVYQAYLSALGTGPSAYWIGVLPLLASLIAADSLAWDRQTGTVRFYLSRVARRTYVLGKWLAVISFTAVIVAIGLGMTGLIAGIVFPDRVPPWHLVHGTATLITAGTPASYRNPFPVFAHELFFSHPLMYVSLVAGLVVLSSTIWASLSLILSIVTANIYMVLAGPWVVYMVTTLVMSLPMISAVPWSPLVMSGPLVNSFPGSVLGAVAYWIITLVLSGVILALYYRQRREIID